MSDDSIGSRIRAARTKLKLSQEELAARCGVHRVTVAKWESNTQEPHRHLNEICRALNEESKWLLTGRRARYADFDVTLKPAKPLAQANTNKEFTEKRVKFNELKIVPLPEFAELKVIEPKASADFNPIFAPQISTVWVDKKFAGEGYYGVSIKGQSMAPTICEGDVAIVSRKGWFLEEYDSERGAALKHEWKKLHRCIVICSINDEEPLCKRLFVTDLPNSEVGFFIQLGSDNSEAPPIAVWKKDRMVVYGVVVASVRDLRPNGGHC